MSEKVLGASESLSEKTIRGLNDRMYVDTPPGTPEFTAPSTRFLPSG